MSAQSTPNKRRRKTDFQQSSQTVRGLDYYFSGKSQQGQPDSFPDRREPPAEDGRRDATTDEDGGDTQTVTDEELARKLQAQWDEQDREVAEHTNGRAEHAVEQNALALKQVEAPPAADGIGETNGVGEAKGDPTAKEPDTSALAALGKKSVLSLQSAAAEEETISHSVPFDESPLTFDPQKYLPELRRRWESEGGSVTYALLTHCFVLVNSTQSRIKIVDTLVNLLRTIIEGDPDSLLPCVWLATNAISPPYIDLELGLGGSAISKALKKVCGLDNAGLKKLYDASGDAGDVAYQAKKRQSITLRKPKPLTVKGVFESLVRIARAKGHGCQEVKQQIVERLVQDARGAEESRYIVRTLVQHLRIGAVKTTMLIALSRAFLLSRPPGADFAVKPRSALGKMSKQDLADVWSPAEELVKASFARRPNYNDLVPTLLEIGIHDELLLRCGLALHIPLRPMLGGITRDLGEMLTKLQGREFSCEFKYDGQRAQVHCDEKGHVTIFSRHLEVMTDKYPDLVALVPQIRGEGVGSFILEGEVVAIDRETGQLKPFQILANRARKDVVIQSVKVDVCLFAFDLMYLNGEELLDRPFRERRSLLRSLFVELPNTFTWVRSLDATSADEETVSEFFKEALDDKCEGIMVKVLDNLPNADLQAEMEVEGPQESAPAPPKPVTASKKSKAKSKSKSSLADGEQQADETSAEKKSGRRKALLASYEPDKRLDSWLKVKKDYSTTADTIDLIPVGGWHGQGRKNAWWSPILLACRNEETGMLEVVTKCISGFTDAFYKANKEKYDEDGPNTISRPSYVHYGGEPDAWFEPQEVWEMAFADITLSPTYTAAIGLVSDERGLSMRFPRFLKVRDDKSIDEASTNEFLASLYRKQSAKVPQAMGRAAEDGEDDEG